MNTIFETDRKKISKICMIAFLITVMFAMMLWNTQLLQVHAAQPYLIKVPMDTKVYVEGTLLGDESLVTVDILHGRIHDIAAAETGSSYAYKEYQISGLGSMDDIKVYDIALQEVTPKKIEIGYLDYTGASVAFEQSVSERVQQAAAAYTNRVAGRGGNGTLASYFQSGSSAYNITVASDQATKWGRFVPATGVVSVTSSDIFPYSDSAFSAKATVTCQETSGYTEQFDIYMLFQNTGSGWYVTNFTFMH